MSLLEIADLEVFYGKSRVVNGVSFDVDQNQVLSLVGPNGAGKTSILDAVFNFVDWDGEIRFDGTDVSGLGASEIAGLGVGYTMEDHTLFPYMSVRDNLLMGAYTNRLVVDDNLDRVYGLFPTLEAREDQRAKTLSGGEQQMLAIGKSLMADPRLLLIDEPTLGLAPVVVDDIADAMASLREETAVLLVEQNVTFGFEHADEVLLLETGELRARGPPDQLRDDEYIRESYLGL